ncbi:MAG: penicillin-binding protein 2 [Actinobacteria bacterium]|nr:penicillin-binding protein 2 [Actinomycetota bacterium]
MSAAINAAVAALLVIALLVVVAVIVKGIYDRQKPLSVQSSAPKMKNVGVGPAPIKEVGSRPGSAEVGSDDASIRNRLLVLGGVAIAVLGTLFVKLWAMQLISSDTYERLSEANRTTTYTTRAVRGRILDRNGTELVGNRASLVVMANSDVANDRNVIHRLSNVLGIPRAAIKQRILNASEGAQAERVVASDVSMRVVSFISEHPSVFPGVNVESRTVRTYPYGSAAAHVLGYTGTISEDELNNSTTVDGLSYESGDIVGKSGAELSFESVLQGVRGTRKVEVDASGSVISILEEIEGKNGNDIRLTIDLAAQQSAEAAILEAFETSKLFKFSNANAGAIVALDLEDGGVLAMASYPTFDPSEFIGGISSDLWDSLNTTESGWPLTNRAISGLYPAASTFKAFCSMTALKHGFATSDSTWNCEGTWTELGEEWSKNCWLKTGHGYVDLVKALVVSCDIAFYEMSLGFYRNREAEPNGLQDGLQEWGFGSQTGIELAGEAFGRVPTADWKAEYNKDTPENALWLPGDMANLVIGQGDVLITPLQNAVAYSGIATGKCLKPHVLLDVLSEEGETVIGKQGEIFREPVYDPAHLELVRTGLREQASANVNFKYFSVVTAGKTGTGQVAGKDDMGWYVGYAPADAPKYLVACCIEQAGSGGSVCTPAVRRVLATLLGVENASSSESSLDESR